MCLAGLDPKGDGERLVRVFDTEVRQGHGIVAVGSDGFTDFPGGNYIPFDLGGLLRIDIVEERALGIAIETESTYKVCIGKVIFRGKLFPEAIICG